ncbi:unnamed protein product [Paramecium octaurelia]|uniref:Uncharacterized protein n=1 Tax=Paramecium octaurelia TaxID=43137 RepID=A0A8S1TL13_PAROT|nr:unnamed protein product [Paramecium octaurelia]
MKTENRFQNLQSFQAGMQVQLRQMHSKKLSYQNHILQEVRNKAIRYCEIQIFDNKRKGQARYLIGNSLAIQQQIQKILVKKIRIMNMNLIF